MNSRADHFRDLLMEMFGEKITNRMVDADFSLKNQGITTSAQQEIKEHLVILENKFGHKILNIYKEWIFDFPGWFGKLDFDNNDLPAKPIMVVGQDPHLAKQEKYGHYELYAAYAACDPYEIENQYIWSIVPFITGYTCSILDTSGKDLIYATDRCYIAPKHVNTTEKEHDANWQNISNIIGGYFIKKQLDILRPKIIVSNGNVAYKMLTENDMYAEIDKKELFSIGNRRPRYIRVAKSKENGVVLISVPHLGRRHSNFWKDTEIMTKAKEIICSKTK